MHVTGQAQHLTEAATDAKPKPCAGPPSLCPAIPDAKATAHRCTPPMPDSGISVVSCGSAAGIGPAHEHDVRTVLGGPARGNRLHVVQRDLCEERGGLVPA